MTLTPRSPIPTRRRSNRRYDREPMRRIAIRGAVTIAVFGAFAYFAISTYNGVPFRGYDHVDALVPRTGNLIAHDPVRIGGLRVGQVQSIKAAANGEAHIRIQLEKGNHLSSDTKIVLRSDGLLGARYVELVPGSSKQALAPGQVIQGGPDSLTYGVTEALDTFDRQTRGDLGSMIGELGTGFLGHGTTLNQAFERGANAIDPFDQMLKQLRSQPQANEALLPSLNGAVGVLDANKLPLTKLFGATATGLQPFVDKGDELRATLAVLPSTLGQANTGLQRARTLLTAARALARSAQLTLPAAPSGLRAAAALLRESPVPLRRATTLLKTAGPTIPALLRITKGASPLLTPLHDLFSDSDTIVNKVAPYGCDIENFGAVFRSMTGMGGFGTGPNGPAMEFRLQAVATPPGEVLGVKDTTGLEHREGYSPPCKFLSKPYDAVDRSGLLGGGK